MVYRLSVQRWTGCFAESVRTVDLVVRAATDVTLCGSFRAADLVVRTSTDGEVAGLIVLVLIVRTSTDGMLC